MQKPDPVKCRPLLSIARLAAALILAAAAVLAPPAALAQAPDGADAEVAPFQWVLISTEGFPASIRHNQSHMTTHNKQTLRSLIAFAYNVDESRVLGGAAWLDEVHYYIVAGNPAEDRSPASWSDESIKLSRDEWRARERAMLADRFSLRVHRETRSVPGYILTVDNGGAKLTPVPESSLSTLNHRGINVRIDQAPPLGCPQALTCDYRVSNVIATAVTLESVADAVGSWLGGPVIDQTALQGHFDFHIPGSFNAASLPQVLRDELGLVLEPHDTAIEVIVVEASGRPTLDAIGPGAWQMREMPGWHGECPKPPPPSSGPSGA